VIVKIKNAIYPYYAYLNFSNFVLEVSYNTFKGDRNSSVSLNPSIPQATLHWSDGSVCCDLSIAYST